MSESKIRCFCSGSNEECAFCLGTGYIQEQDHSPISTNTHFKIGKNHIAIWTKCKLCGKDIQSKAYREHIEKCHTDDYLYELNKMYVEKMYMEYLKEMLKMSSEIYYKLRGRNSESRLIANEIFRIIGKIENDRGISTKERNIIVDFLLITKKYMNHCGDIGSAKIKLLAAQRIIPELYENNESKTKNIKRKLKGMIDDNDLLNEICRNLLV